MTTTTKVAHTPGPWEVELQLGLPVICTETGMVVAEPLVAQGIGALYGVDGKDIVANIEANARLIAAAPDYYKAVDYWLEQIYDGEPLKDWQVELIAAHRKAKGE